MKKFLIASALVLATAATVSAQTPTGTPPSGTTPPSGSTPGPKPDATIDTQVNAPGSQANPADKADGSMQKGKATKHKNGKMKTKEKPSSTM